MMSRRALVPVLMSALVVSASPVLAAPKTAVEQEINSAQPDKTQLRAFQQTKISIADAIAAAEKRTPGSKAIDAGFDAAQGRPVFNVKTYQNNSVWEGTIDAQSGQVVGQGKTTPQSPARRGRQGRARGLTQRDDNARAGGRDRPEARQRQSDECRPGRDERQDHL